MAEIEINKDELKSAVTAFKNAISAYETASSTFATVAGSLESQSSNFVNQMKVWLEYAADSCSKDIIESLETYAEAADRVATGFMETDDALAKGITDYSKLPAGTDAIGMGYGPGLLN